MDQADIKLEIWTYDTKSEFRFNSATVDRQSKRGVVTNLTVPGTVVIVRHDVDKIERFRYGWNVVGTVDSLWSGANGSRQK